MEGRQVVPAFCQQAKETVVSVWADEILSKQASLRCSEIMKFSSIAAVNELLTAEALTPALFLRFNISVTYTYLLPPWSRVLLEELTSSQLYKKYPVF